MTASATIAAAPKLSWLLRLPPELMKPFNNDRGVQRTLAVLDALALLHTILVQGQLFKTFRPLTTSQMCLHERCLNVLFILLAFAHLAFLAGSIASGRGAYHKRRHVLAVTFRVLRLVSLLLSALFLTPAQAHKQVLRVFTHGLRSKHTAAAPVSTAAAASAVVAAAAAGGEGAAAADAMRHLARLILVAPLVYASASSFVLPLPAVLVLQALTFVGCVGADLPRLCPTIAAFPELHSTAARVCRLLADYAAATQGLLGLEALPGLERRLAAADDALCGDPLASLLLLMTWVQLVVLVLLPCVMVFCLESSLKSRFLASHAAAAAAAAAAAREAAPASTAAAAANGGAPQEQQTRQPGANRPGGGSSSSGELVFAHVEPLALGASGLWTVAVRAALLVGGVVASWLLAGAIVSLMLRGGRRLECNAAGVLVW